MPQETTQQRLTIPRDALHASRRAGRKQPPLLRGRTTGSPDDGSVDVVINESLEISVPEVLAECADEVRVLHVDDSPEYTELTKTVIEDGREQFTVATETSALEGLRRLRESRFDCIVADYQMPTTDGLEFLELVREEHPDLPFILFTGAGDEALASRAIAAGVTDYVRKHGGTDQFDVLANRIDNAVERYRTQQQFWDALSLYQRLVEQDFTGVCVVQNGEFIYVNRHFADILGRDREDLLGTSPSEVLCGSRQRAENLFDERAQRFSRECELERADGSTFTVEIHGGAVQCGGEPGCIGVVWDQ